MKPPIDDFGFRIADCKQPKTPLPKLMLPANYQLVQRYEKGWVVEEFFSRDHTRMLTEWTPERGYWIGSEVRTVQVEFACCLVRIGHLFRLWLATVVQSSTRKPSHG